MQGPRQSTQTSRNRWHPTIHEFPIHRSWTQECAKHNAIGEGKVVPSTSLDDVTPPPMVVSPTSSSAEVFQPMKPRRRKLEETSETEVEKSDDDDNDQVPGLFACPEEGCVKVCRRCTSDILKAQESN